MFAHSCSIPIENGAADWQEWWHHLPSRAAVFALYADSAATNSDPHADQHAPPEPYISKTANLRRRLQRLLSPDTNLSKRLNLAGKVHRLAYTQTGSDLETALLLYNATREWGGDRARKRLHLRPPAVLRMAWENAHPRIYATHRMTMRTLDHTYGPFPSRLAAERFLDDSLNLFLLRRCTEDLHPDPAFPGCVYSEMKMCLAPCFHGCTETRYAQEAEAVRAYFATRGASLLAALENDRDAASSTLDFETASHLHTRIQKVTAIAHQAAPLVHPISQLDAIILQPALDTNHNMALPSAPLHNPDNNRDTHTDTAAHVAIFLVKAGIFYGPACYSLQGMVHPNEQSGSSSLFAQPTALAPTPLPWIGNVPTTKATRPMLEERLRELMQQLHVEAAACQNQQDCLADHLTLLARWYYRPATKRTGEIFFRDSSGEFPLPKILRGISRVARGARNPEELASAPATLPAE